MKSEKTQNVVLPVLVFAIAFPILVGSGWGDTLSKGGRVSLACAVGVLVALLSWRIIDSLLQAPIETVHRLQLEPGDAILVSVDSELSMERVEQLREHVMARLPGREVLVTSKGITLTAIHQVAEPHEDEDARAA